MGLFKKDPIKVAQRQRRREQRRRDRANNAARRAREAEAEAGIGEDATIEGRDANGNPVRQNVKLHKPGSKKRNARIMALEERLEDALERIEDLEEELEDAKADAEQGYDSFLGTLSGLAGAARAVVQLINQNDKVENPMGLVLSDGLAELATSAKTEGSRQGYRIGSLAAKAWAYMGSGGINDVITSDPQNTKTPPGES